MPQTKFQKFVFGALMSVFMVFGMEVFNVSNQMGGLSPAVFPTALKECSYMVFIVFLFSTLFGGRAAKAIAFRHVAPGRDNPFFITLLISACTVLVMCPSMSLVATAVFTGFGPGFFLRWASTAARNFPMALLWQLFFAGPAVRLIFGLLFRPAQAKEAEDVALVQTAE